MQPASLLSADDDRLIPDPKVCERYDISDMTLYRWDRDPDLNFPPPIRINRRKYRKLSALMKWERARAKQTTERRR